MLGTGSWNSFLPKAGAHDFCNRLCLAGVGDLSAAGVGAAPAARGGSRSSVGPVGPSSSRACFHPNGFAAIQFTFAASRYICLDTFCTVQNCNIWFFSTLARWAATSIAQTQLAVPKTGFGAAGSWKLVLTEPQLLRPRAVFCPRCWWRSGIWLLRRGLSTLP